MKGKWFVGVISALLITVTLSGCITTADDCFYYGFEKAKVPETPISIQKDHQEINISLDVKDNYVVKSIRFLALDENASEGKDLILANVTIILEDANGEIFNESTLNDGEAIFEAAKGDTPIAKPVWFKTTEGHNKSARDIIIGDGRYIKDKILTLNF